MAMSIALRSLGLLDVLSGTSVASSVARLVFIPISTASLRNLVTIVGKSAKNMLVSLALGTKVYVDHLKWPCLAGSPRATGLAKIESKVRGRMPGQLRLA
jgi:hypothetical protein